MIEHTLIRPQQSYMFRLIAKSSKLPERCRIISDRLLAQLGRGKLKGARQINVNHSMVLYNHLALMEGLCPDFPLLLEAVNNIFVAPTNFVRKALRLDESPPNFEVIVNSPLLCSISALASIEGPAKPLVQPFASSYHKEAGRPRRVSDVQGRQYRVRSCGAPCP